ncbi:MAG: hydrogenase nickel incorporation protein HypB [Bacteroides sp.]|jgi:hydrogenase nickel incorporation protein HypB|nr:hydrogenase nickel incorporation protein HypB [Bacteroides sp.]
MCQTCGCEGKENMVTIGKPVNFEPKKQGKKPERAPAAPSPFPWENLKIDRPAKDPGSEKTREIEVVENLLGENDAAALENRKYLIGRKIFSLNLMGSPGCGKTTFIIKTIEALKSEMVIYVIEGDQFGSLDAKRISATGARVIQINTGNGCHLDARSVGKALKELGPQEHSLLFIENVGNLVCPALFDLGENLRTVMLSVTEGDDKPIKYAPMFHGASTCLINKTDLVDFVDFDLEIARENLRKINPRQKVISLSTKSGNGMEEWLTYIRKEIKALKPQEGNTDPA